MENNNKEQQTIHLLHLLRDNNNEEQKAIHSVHLLRNNKEQYI